MSKSEPIGTAEAAAALRCTTRQVARLVAAGRLEPLRKMPGLRGPYVFEREDVERLAAERAGAA